MMGLRIGQNLTEKEIITGCLKGDNKSQRYLYDRYAPIMLTVCRRYIKDQGIAEEIMIKGFTLVFDKLDQFRMEGSFEGWIRRIMVNESLGWLRKNRNMYLEVDIDEANRELYVEQISAVLHAEELMRMINELPQGYRTVFNLYAIEGYSHMEIAEKLGISVNTSKSQLSRARSYLQKQLLEIEKSLNAKRIGNGS